MNFMRAGPQLGVAKAARAPPCTLPILGRRFYLFNEEYSSYLNQYLTYTFNNIHSLIRPNFYH